jgi:hypothetical protein
MEFFGAKKVDELIRKDTKIIEQQIIDFMISLQGLSRATKSLRMAAVVDLYSINDINPQQKKIEQIPGPKTNEEDKTTNDVF